MWELFNKYQYISLRRKKYRFTANQLLNRGNFISRLTSDTLVRDDYEFATKPYSC